MHLCYGLLDKELVEKLIKWDDRMKMILDRINRDAILGK